jgi:hypothetical protein
MSAAHQLARLCENSGLWGASPKSSIEGSKKLGSKWERDSRFWGFHIASR